tara:strand:- start:714 stop:1772 length:1059 start_codon:yes stop_codon:yes gene_type:complete
MSILKKLFKSKEQQEDQKDFETLLILNMDVAKGRVNFDEFTKRLKEIEIKKGMPKEMVDSPERKNQRQQLFNNLRGIENSEITLEELKDIDKFMHMDNVKKHLRVVSEGQTDFDTFLYWTKDNATECFGSYMSSFEINEFLKSVYEDVLKKGKGFSKECVGNEDWKVTTDIDGFLNPDNSNLTRQQRRFLKRQEKKRNKNKNNETRVIPFPNGKTMGEIPMKNNTANGVMKMYWESGKLRSEVNMVDGQEHGFCRSYYENGQIEYDSNKKNNRVHGHQKQYDENGQLRVENNWVDGELNGESKVWWSNGKPKSFGHFKNNKHHGFFREWDENGELTLEVTYVDGKEVNPQVA